MSNATVICDECSRESPVVLTTGDDQSMCFDCAGMYAEEAATTVAQLIKRFVGLISDMVAIYETDERDWILVAVDVEETDDFDLLSAALGNLHSKAGEGTTVTLDPESVAFMDVESSNLDEVAFRQPSNTLYIRFQDTDGVYLYAGFDGDDWSRFSAADSWGKHFHAEIKDQYPFVHVT